MRQKEKGGLGEVEGKAKRLISHRLGRRGKAGDVQGDGRGLR